ncbi:cell division protein FtsQ [Pasteurellaceae bacterium RH1A]|nr:cell division protein FtsQ [Pasteurellaceae bacterium RH1A]
MTLSRRQFLQKTALAAGLIGLPAPLLAQDRPALKIPPLIEVGRGRPVRLDFRPAQTQFNQGKLADVWGVNGQYLGPTVRVRSGNFIKLTYNNSLPQALSVNIQGLLTPTEMLGSKQRKIEPKASWSPIVNINQPAATAWYHASTLFNSAFQTYRGLAGLWMIEDENSRKLKLPNQYGVNDIPLILQDQLINTQGVQVLDNQAPQFLGNRLFVNGQESPHLVVSRGWVRLRIVNASLSRAYDLALDNGQPLYLIATGMGMLAEPLAQERIWLAPSERVEVLANLNEGGQVSLITGQKRGILDKVSQLFADNDYLKDNVILELRPEGLVSVFTDLPQLTPINLDDFKLKIDQERKFNLRPLDRTINQQRFDPKRIDFTVKQGSVERWYLSSVDPIGFNIQGAKFIVETRSGKQESIKKLAWQDTVWLNPNELVTILVKFDHKASQDLPFSYGVTDLMLADKGAMGQFTCE